MSNYAPNPEQEKVYDNLQNKTLGNVTAADIQKLTDPTFIQATNQDALITYNIVNKAAMRDGQPMPNTQKIVQSTYTDTGSNDFFVPNDGEVWKIVGGDTIGTGGTFSVQWQLKDESGTLALLFQTSVSGQEPIGKDNSNLVLPIYVSSTNYLVANVSAVVTSGRASISFIRVR
jgi:hypothetical protein